LPASTAALAPDTATCTARGRRYHGTYGRTWRRRAGRGMAAGGCKAGAARSAAALLARSAPRVSRAAAAHVTRDTAAAGRAAGAPAPIRSRLRHHAGAALVPGLAAALVPLHEPHAHVEAVADLLRIARRDPSGVERRLVADAVELAAAVVAREVAGGGQPLVAQVLG